MSDSGAVNTGGGQPGAAKGQAQIPAPWEKWAKGAIISAAILLLIVAVWTGVFSKIFRLVPNVRFGNIWVWALAGYGMIHYAALVWRICLWLSYRPMPPCMDEELPTVSVVIPAYNEGKRIGPTLDNILAYLQSGSGQAEVIVVNDGSKDDTVQAVERRAAAPHHHDRSRRTARRCA